MAKPVVSTNPVWATRLDEEQSPAAPPRVTVTSAPAATTMAPAAPAPDPQVFAFDGSAPAPGAQAAAAIAGDTQRVAAEGDAYLRSLMSAPPPQTRMVSPGGKPVPETRKAFSPEVDVSPEEMAGIESRLDGAQEAETEARELRVQAEDAARELEANASIDKRLAAQEYDDRMAPRVAAQAAKVKQAEGEVAKWNKFLTEKYNQLPEKPSLWAGKNFGEQLLTGIGVALKGLAAGTSDKQYDSSMEWLYRKAHENIELQQRMFEHGAAAKTHAESLYGQALKEFGNPEQAKQAALGTTYKMIDAELARWKDKISAPAYAKLQEANEKYKHMADEQAMAKFRAASMQKTELTEKFSKPQYATTGGNTELERASRIVKQMLPDGTPEQKAFLMERLLKQPGMLTAGSAAGPPPKDERERLKDEMGRRVLLADGKSAYVTSTEDPKKVQSKYDAGIKMSTILEESAKEIENLPITGLAPNERKARESRISGNVSIATGLYKQLLDLDALDQEERAAAGPIVGSEAAAFQFLKNTSPEVLRYYAEKFRMWNKDAERRLSAEPWRDVPISARSSGSPDEAAD